jgi:hypothetical protein
MNSHPPAKAIYSKHTFLSVGHLFRIIHGIFDPTDKKMLSLTSVPLW